MANNLSVQQIQQIRAAFLQGFLNYTPQYPRIGRVVTGVGGKVRVGGLAAGGRAQTVARTDTSVAAQNIASFEAEFTTSHKVVKHRLPAFVFKNDPGMDEIGMELAKAVGKNIDADFFSMLEGLTSADHPRVGTDVGCVGASKKYFSASLKYLCGESGEATQANLLTAALSAANLDAAVQLLLKYKDDRGMQMQLGLDNKLALIVAAKNWRLASQLVGSAVTSSDQQTNVVGGKFGGGVINWEFSDDDDWMVVDTSNSPVGMYVDLESIKVLQGVSEDSQFISLTAEYDATPIYSPYEAGAVFSNVA